MAYAISIVLILAGFIVAATTNHPGVAGAMVFVGVLFGGVGMALDPNVGE